jgi:hypothetical protein
MPIRMLPEVRSEWPMHLAPPGRRTPLGKLLWYRAYNRRWRALHPVPPPSERRKVYLAENGRLA